jgi:hypothetical protein
MFGLSGGRSRWIAVGAVVATLFGGGQLLTASAAGSANASSFVPITPCRLLDTRASDQVGPRGTPLGPVTTYTATVWGANGNCNIPAGATGFSMNVVVINPTAASFLTVFPADATRPLASSLNWVAGQPPTPNAVTVAASADGKVSFYNLSGDVDLAVDIVGYYELATTGPAGPPGPKGDTGAKGDTGLTGEKGDTGDPGPRPSHIVWVAKSGGDFTSVSAALTAIGTSLPAATATDPYLIKIAPGTYDEVAGIDLEADVSIEGSGVGVTVLRSSAADVVRGSGALANVELRNLSVDNLAGPPKTYTALRLTNVTGAVTVRAASLHVGNNATSNSRGVAATSSNAQLVDITTTTGTAVDGFGLLADGTSIVRVNGGSLGSNVGVGASNSAQVFIEGAAVGGFPFSALTTGTAKISIAGSMVSGRKLASATGPITCVASFDNSLTPLADCPT